MVIPKFKSPVTNHPIIKVVKEATILHVIAFARWRLGFTDILYLFYRIEVQLCIPIKFLLGQILFQGLFLKVNPEQSH